jgi:hypothetical protein
LARGYLIQLEFKTIAEPEYRTNKRPFPRSRRVSSVHQTVVNLRVDAVLAEIAPLSRQKFRTSAQFFGGFHARDDSDPAAPSMSPHMLAWLMRLSRTSGPGADPETVANAQ